jgi:hypothetical protein
MELLILTQLQTLIKHINNIVNHMHLPTLCSAAVFI